MKMFRKDEGFTLVELMVVVLIIGILIAIAIPVFNAASNTARAKSCMSNQRIIESAVQQYLGANVNNTIDDVDGDVTTANPLVAGGTYIKSTPVCPSAAGAYVVDSGGYTSCPTSITAPTTHARP